MPTEAERIATLEVLAAENRRIIMELHADIHSGPGVEWKQSLRGQLHAVREALATADKLAEAAREVRRAADSQHKTRLKLWQWTLLASCAVVTAACAVVSAVYLVLG